MENATKALLIAAAVLIAILIISFALIIYNMASETVGNVNLSEAEMAQFNAKFKSYEGERVTAKQIDKMCSAVITHNQQEKNAGTKRYVKVINSKNNGILVDETISQVNFAPQNRYYKVVCHYENGLINKIAFTILEDK